MGDYNQERGGGSKRGMQRKRACSASRANSAPLSASSNLKKKNSRYSRGCPCGCRCGCRCGCCGCRCAAVAWQHQNSPATSSGGIESKALPVRPKGMGCKVPIEEAHGNLVELQQLCDVLGCRGHIRAASTQTNNSQNQSKRNAGSD